MLQALRSALTRVMGHHHDHQYLGRYSVDKLCVFDQYQRTTSALHVAAVILCTPLPTLFALVLMDVVPMNSPSAGPRHNAVAFVRSTVSHAVMTFFTLLPLKQALSLSHRDYSFTTIACIACGTALAIEAVVIPLAFTWRFPVPCREMIGLPVWGTAVCVLNLCFANTTIRRLWRRRKLQRYLPIVGVQVTLFYLFLALSVGFGQLTSVLQTAMILTFPLLKVALKRMVWKYARALNDLSTDVTVCMVEVSGALYQTVCLQFVTSPALSVLIMVTDVLQAALEVRSYTTLDYLSDGRRTVPTALKIVESALGVAKNSERRSSLSLRRSLSATVGLTGHGADGVAVDRWELRISSTHQPSHPSQPSQASQKPHASDATEPVYSGRGSDGSDSNAAAATKRLAHLIDPTTRLRLRLHGRSVVIHPATVRTAKLVRRRKTRRLLNLDRITAEASAAAAVASLAHDGSKNDTRAEPHEHEHGTAAAGDVSPLQPRFDSDVRPKATTGLTLRRRPSLRRRHSATITSSRDVVRRLFLNRQRRRERRSGKIYAVNDRADVEWRERTTRVEHTASYHAPLPRPDTVTPDVSSSPSQTSTDGGRHHSAVVLDGVLIPRRHQARVLEQTLQLLFVCEVLLFAEYMEVVIPVLYSLTIAGEWLTPNAQYSVVVRALSRDDVHSQVANALLYALLELASLLAMYVVMKRKYGVSAFYQSAFVLETYWLTLQGKLVGAFIVVLNAVTVHQGAAWLVGDGL